MEIRIDCCEFNMVINLDELIRITGTRIRTYDGWATYPVSKAKKLIKFIILNTNEKTILDMIEYFKVKGYKLDWYAYELYRKYYM